MLRIAHQLISILHVPERNLLGSEKIKRDPSVVPRLVTAAEILEKQIVFRQLIAEVIFDACASRHQVAPKRVLADIMQGANILSLRILAIEPLIAGIRGHAESGSTLLVIGNYPGPSHRRR